MHTHHFDGRHALHHVQNLLQNLLHMRSVIGHAGHAEHRFLPEILRIDFSQRNIELSPQTIFQTVQDLSLLFERLTLMNQQFDGTNTDNHVFQRIRRSMTSLEFRRNLIDRVGFDHVAGLHVVKVLDADTTLISLLHFAHVIFESAQ